MKTKCDKCEKEFELKDKKKQHPEGIVEEYFTCPHCNKKYIYLVTDAALRKEQKEIKELHEQYITRKNKAISRSEELKQKIETNDIVDNAMKAVDNMLDNWNDEDD